MKPLRVPVRVAGTVLAAGALLLRPARIPAQPVERAAAASGASVHLRYAERRLELARLDLEKARRQNAEAGSAQVPAADLRRLEVRVAALEEVVEAERKTPDGGRLDGQIARAQAALEVVRDDLARLERLHAAMPNAVPEIDLRRQRVRVEIAELRLALWQDPEHRLSAIEQMQIQIDQLIDQLADLIEEISNRRLVTPPP
jgi:chromosome segregation ATPase